MGSFPERIMIHIGIFAFDIYIGSFQKFILPQLFIIFKPFVHMFFRPFFLAYMCKFDKKRNVAFQELVEDNFS